MKKVISVFLFVVSFALISIVCAEGKTIPHEPGPERDKIINFTYSAESEGQTAEINLLIEESKERIIIEGSSDVLYQFLGIKERRQLLIRSIINSETLSTTHFFMRRVYYEKNNSHWKRTETKTREAAFHPEKKEVERLDRKDMNGRNKIYSENEDYPLNEGQLVDDRIIVDPISIFYFIMRTNEIDNLNGKEIMYSRGKGIYPYRFSVWKEDNNYVVKITTPEAPVSIKCWLNGNQEIEKIEMIFWGPLPNVEMYLEKREESKQKSEAKKETTQK